MILSLTIKQVNALIDNLKNIIQAPFRAVSGVLHPDSQPSSILASLVSSASTPLFTALIILLPSGVFYSISLL